MTDLQNFWEERYRKYGHTGWKIPQIYNYDQRLRIRAFHSILKELDIDIDSKVMPKALDIGCGTGDFLERLHQMGYSCKGIDISEDVIRHAKNRFKNIRNINLFNEDISQKNFFNEKYDLIISITVLQHILNNQKYLLKKLYNSLTNKGYFVLLESVGEQENNEHYLNYRTKKEWESVFASCGFTIVDAKSYPNWGIELTQILGRMLNRLGKKQGIHNNSTKEYNISFIHNFFIRIVLSFAYIFDYVLSLPIPKNRAKRLFFILKRSVNDE